MSRGHKTCMKRWDFNIATIADSQLRVQDSVVTTSLVDGNLQFDAGAAGNSTVDLGGTNGFPLADLLTFEATLKTDLIDDDLDIRVGMASAFNADPDAIAEVAMFKIRGKAGAANANDIFVETDDGTTDNRATATNKVMAIDTWTRFRIDFAKGIQTRDSPAGSLGGLGSVRFSTAREGASGTFFMEHIHPQETAKHMDMSAASGPLQPYIQVRLVGAPDATVTVDLREIEITHRVW